MTIFLLIILLGLAAYHICVRYSKSGQLVNKIPGPTAIPLVGNMLSLNVPADKAWSRIFDFSKKYYPIFKLWFSKSAMILIQHPDDLKIFFTDRVNLEKSSGYDNLKICAADGLVMSKPEMWRERRKLLTPAFSPSMLRMSAEIVDKYGKKLIEHLRSQGDETVQRLVPLFTKYTMSVILESAMGVDSEKSDVIIGEEKFRHALDVVCEVTLYRVLRPYIKDWMLNWIPIGRKQQRVLKDAYIFRDKVINERREYLERTGYKDLENFNADDTEADSATPGRRNLAVLDLLLLAQRDGLIDAKGIAEEVNTFIAAGYDTSGYTICFAIMLLAENKEAQDRARAEVVEMYEQCGGNITIAELPKLDYVERCLKESMRILPIVPKIGRHLTTDKQLTNYLVPAHTELIAQIFNVHRDPNFWPEPEKFDPDRFLPEQCKKRHPYAYAPFSAGIRNCIGQRYAIMELKILMAHVLYNYYIEPVDATADMKFCMHLQLQPSKPMHAKFIKIDRNNVG